MGSFLQALGSLGQDVGDAGQLRKDNALKQGAAQNDKTRLGFEGQRVKNEDLRLLLERQKELDTEKSAELGRQKLKQDIAGYGWEHSIPVQQGDHYLQINTVTGERRDVPKEEYDVLAAKSKPKPKLQGWDLKQDKSGRWVHIPKDPTLGDKDTPSDTIGRLATGRVGAGTPLATPAEVARDAASIQDGKMTLKDVPSKRREAVANYMDENKLTAKRVLTTAEKKQVDDIHTVEPLVARMKDYLEQNQLIDAGGIQDRIKSGIEWARYRSGLPPSDPKLGKLIQLAAALKIKGAAPLISAVGRSKYAYEQIVQHLPETTDTPALLYKKVMFLAPLLEDAKSSLGMTDAAAATAQPDDQVNKLLQKYNIR